MLYVTSLIKTTFNIIDKNTFNITNKTTLNNRDDRTEMC